MTCWYCQTIHWFYLEFYTFDNNLKQNNNWKCLSELCSLCRYLRVILLETLTRELNLLAVIQNLFGRITWHICRYKLKLDSLLFFVLFNHILWLCFMPEKYKSSMLINLKSKVPWRIPLNPLKGCFQIINLSQTKWNVKGKLLLYVYIQKLFSGYNSNSGNKIQLSSI